MCLRQCRNQLLRITGTAKTAYHNTVTIFQQGHRLINGV